MSFVVFTAYFADLKAQKSIIDSAINVAHIDINYSFQIPSADLANRFGFFHGVGMGFHYKTKSNLEFGAEGIFLFGNQIRERTLINNLLTTESTVLDRDGNAADLLVSLRGWQIRANAGKVIPLGNPNDNSGVLIRVGVGLLQHKMRVEDRQVNTPQLAWPYQRGYDRLTNGLLLSQLIGYQLFSNNKLINFYAGVELNEAFTQNRRPYNFSEKREDNEPRFDASVGFRVGWMILLYKRAPRDFYYD